MKKIIKNLGKIIAWFVAIILILVVIAYLTVGYWIKPIVSRIVPNFTQTSASLTQADISLFKGHISIGGLKIGNPSGYADPNVFELGEITIDFQPKSILTDKIIVDSVLIKGTKISAEMNKDMDINLMTLNQNVQKALTQPTSTDNNTIKDTPQTIPQKSSKAVVIKDLKILDTSLRFGFMGNVVALTTPDIHEQNIGEKKKSTIKEMVATILNKLTFDSIKQIEKSSQQLVKDSLNKVLNKSKGMAPVKGLLDSLGGLF